MFHFPELIKHLYDSYFDFFSSNLYTSVSLELVFGDIFFDWTMFLCFFLCLVTL